MTKREKSYAAPDRFAASRAADASPVDLICLKRIASEANERVAELVDYYLQVTRGQLKKIDRAVRRRSGAEVKSLAHSCIGASTLLGMRAIVIPLRRLESLGIHGEWDRAREATAEAWRELELMKSFIKSAADGEANAQSTRR